MKGDPRHNRKPSRDEWQERLEFCARLMAKCLHKSQIKRAMAEKYGLCARSVENWIARVREHWAKESKGLHKDDLKAEALAVYREIMLNPKSRVSDILRARERMDILQGLEVSKMELSAPNGAPLPVAQDKVIIIEMPATGATSAQDQDEFEKARSEALEARGRNGNGNGHHEPAG